uniref:G-protein coupled receptors family 3 profile domain-containing protein n=1 Tax=Lotharella globosa TaxID=91324 RepID=A0A7S3YVB1_9EUKA|mmetsp:Transcript_18298/g.36916  ORF Transcript_18298/g.36916 Transcript_18298/m.36916 type:complete len:812 (+) Transcript_18298:124-2559(+)|eukprot:CAMPEP_0167800232 /NCGR_PEP_ID=MMETSP0111_2-20121227/17591_1 /TAXON_ID=91324 /ORGANISM="Lotharella globosa, Strain CCCM811" /LENGTH=811 /DNA_ID=CAMNT_0007695417 /DNA_START=41 /DNA_END=2476 /DNA_ORIENTATION=+
MNRYTLNLLLALAYTSSATGPTCPCECGTSQTTLKTKFETATTQCLSNTVLSNLGISPADRKGASVKFEIQTWPSQQISTLVGGILAKEAMGYQIEWTCGSSGFNALARIANKETDCLIEFWLDTYYPDAVNYINTQQAVVNAGFAGYTGRAGLYIPQYTESLYSALSLTSADFTNFVANSADFWRSHQIPEVIALYASQNDSAIISSLGLTLEYSFTPPWCKPWNSTGIGNNCADVKAEVSAYDRGQLHQVIINRRLNWTVSYWGTAGVQSYVSAKITRTEPIVFKYWEPTKFIASNSLHRLSLPAYTQLCYSNNTNSLEGAGSVDCDYPTISLRKIVSPSVVPSDSKDVYNNFGAFIRRFDIPQAQMDNVLTAIQNSSIDEYDAACNWLNDNTATWQNWIYNSYSPPKEVIWQISSRVKLTIIAFGAIGLIVALACMLFIAAYRADRMIKSSSIMLSLFTLIGFTLVIMTSFFIIDDAPTLAVCTFQVWLPFIGSMIAISSLGAKTYRIYKIFFNTVDNVSFTDCYLLRYIVVPTLVLILILTISTIVTPPEPTQTTITDGDTITIYRHCPDASVAEYVAEALMAISVIGLAKLAYDAREAPEQFNEAKQLGLALYTMILASVIGVPLFQWMKSESNFDEYCLVLGLYLTLTSIITILLLYGYRFLNVIIGDYNRHSGNSSKMAENNASSSNNSALTRSVKRGSFSSKNHSRFKSKSKIDDGRSPGASTTFPMAEIKEIRERSPKESSLNSPEQDFARHLLTEKIGTLTSTINEKDEAISELQKKEKELKETILKLMEEKLKRTNPDAI